MLTPVDECSLELEFSRQARIAFNSLLIPEVGSERENREIARLQAQTIYGLLSG